MEKAFQDHYADSYSHCYGCGRNNPQGHQLKSYWDGDDTIAHFTPRAEYSGGVPDHVYGGLIASLLDCHGAASAAAYTWRAMAQEGRATEQPVRYVTASLKVDFRAPTPMGTELTIRGRLRSMEGRKLWIDMTLSAGDKVCASAEMLAIRLREEPAAVGAA